MTIWLLWVGAATAAYAQEPPGEAGPDDLRGDLQEARKRLDEIEKKMAAQEPKVDVGFGTLRFNGLLQVWYVHVDNGADLDNGDLFTGEDDDGFRVRRAELRFTGTVVPEKVQWGVMIDPSRALGIDETGTQARRLLQDVWIKLEGPALLGAPGKNVGPFESLSLSVGQFKLPISMEGYGSSSTLDFIERAKAARRFGDQRDIGALLRGGGDLLDVQAGIFNGEGQNRLVDQNDSKQYNARLVLKPLKGLALGASWQDGETGKDPVRKDRHGFEFSLVHEKIFSEQDRAFLKAEWLVGKDGPLVRRGGYWSFGYAPVEEVQVVIRYDEFVREDSTWADRNELRDWTLGVNYFLEDPYAKVQVNYIRRVEEGPDVDNDMILLALQVSF